MSKIKAPKPKPPIVPKKLTRKQNRPKPGVQAPKDADGLPT